MNKKQKLNLNIWKMTFMWLPLLHMYLKSKKIVRKNRKDPNTYSEEYRYYWIKKAVKKMLYVLDVKIFVEGIENWLDKGIVLAPNHQSNIDPLVMLAINNFSIQQPVAFIAKKELWDHKIFGNFLRMIDAIPLDRNNPRSALLAFKDAKNLVVNYKRSLVIFPEGTRSNSQEIGEFLPASTKIAQMSNAPIVPVTIINSYLTFSEKRPKKVEIKVIFAKPISPKKHIALETANLTSKVKLDIESNMTKYKDVDLNIDIKKLNSKIKTKLEDKNKIKEKKPKKIKDFFNIVD